MLRFIAAAFLAALVASSSARAQCTGPMCPVTPSPELLAIAPGQPLANQLLAPPRKFVPPRDATPFGSSVKMPPPDQIDPLTAIAFELTDIQVARMLQPASQARRFTYHTLADDAGRTYSHKPTSNPFLGLSPYKLSAALTLLLLSAASFFWLSLNKPIPDSAGASEAARNHDVLLLPEIEWAPPADSLEQGLQSEPQLLAAQAHPPQPPTWSALVALCGGDVMRAAAAIDSVVREEPSLEPGSTLAIQRALATVEANPA